MSNPYTVFRIDRDGHVATLWLDNAAKRNAMGRAFWEELPRAMAELDADADVRAIVLAAEGPAFTAGLDLKEFGPSILSVGTDGEVSPAGQRRALLDTIMRLQASISAVADSPKPTIAAMHGWCIGGAIDLSTACDIRLAAADAVFSVRETKIAIVADVGTLQRLPGIVGRGHVAELVFTGKDIDAARAKEIHFVNDVYPDREACIAAAQEMAAEIAANSPLVTQGAKAVLRFGEGKSVADALKFVAVWNSAFVQSNDLVEAMSAFVERRPPVYTGQ